MARPRIKTPTPAATGMGAGYRKLGGDRFIPFIINPFDPAMSIAQPMAIVRAEASRRAAVLIGVARAVS